MGMQTIKTHINKHTNSKTHTQADTHTHKDTHRHTHTHTHTHTHYTIHTTYYTHCSPLGLMSKWQGPAFGARSWGRKNTPIQYTNNRGPSNRHLRNNYRGPSNCRTEGTPGGAVQYTRSIKT